MVTSSSAERPLASVKGCLYVAHGAYLVLAGLVVAVFCWVIPYLLQEVAGSELVDPDQVRPLARWVLDHRNIMPLLGLPPVIFGLVALFKAPLRWLWVTLGVLSLLAPGVILIYTFVVTVGLLYQTNG
ncbi:MAG: hypothetical protein ACYTF2_07460 [Planctomycetota bacterium]